MKKTIWFLLIILNFMGCNAQDSSHEAEIKEKICQGLYEATGHKFKFIYGFDYDGSMGTNIKYKGFLYSDYLENLNYPGGVQANLEKLEVDDELIYQLAEEYKGTLMQVEIDALGLEKAKELFGEKVNILNQGSTTAHMYENIVVKKSQKIDFKDKSAYLLSHINVFVEDLGKIDHQEFKKNTFELGKYIFEELNYHTALAVYVRDNSYFEDYNLVYNSIYGPFLQKEEVKIVLQKIKNKEKISESERDILIKNFYTNLDYEVCHYKKFKISFSDKPENFPMKLENARYDKESINGKWVYDNTLGDEE